MKIQPCFSKAPGGAAGDIKTGFDEDTCIRANQVKTLVDEGIEVSIVIGEALGEAEAVKLLIGPWQIKHVCNC